MDKQKIYILNPDYKFKNDEDRVVMYSQTDVRNDSEKEWIGFIHPYQALLLGLFTNESTFEEHCKDCLLYTSYSLAVRFACKDKDTLGVLLSKEQIANVLYLQNRRDEACKLREWLHDEYLKNGFVREASKVLVPNVSTLLGRGKVEEVGRILRSYEEHSGDVDLSLIHI